MKITNLKNKLTAFDICAYDYERADHLDENGRPVSEIGYIRADHDGYRWWSTGNPTHPKLGTPEIVHELNELFDAFTRSFKDLRAMGRWCGENAKRIYDGGGDYYYLAYYESDLAAYKFRMNTRRGDYNLYLYCYSKNAMT